MKRKIFPALSFNANAVSIVIIFIATIFQFACNDSNDQANKSFLISDQKEMPFTKNWIALTVTFKPNTSSEMRDVSISAIEKLIMDTIYSMRSGNHSGFSPTFWIGKKPFGDSLDYQFNIQYPSASDTVGKPPCTCQNNCGVCIIITRHFENSKSDTSQIAAPYRNIAAIYFRPDDMN